VLRSCIFSLSIFLFFALLAGYFREPIPPPLFVQQTLPTQLAHNPGTTIPSAADDTNEANDGDEAAFLRRCLLPKSKPPVPLRLRTDEADKEAIL
jgi:hypothetical protein